MHKAAVVVFTIMRDGMPVNNQVLAVPVADVSVKTRKHSLWFPALGSFVKHLCRTYRYNGQNVGSTYSLMELAGVNVNRNVYYFEQQLSAPQWVNLLTAVNNTLVTSDFNHPMQLWFALRDRALDLCLPGAFGYWRHGATKPAPTFGNEIVDTGGLGWLFDSSPVQPSQPVLQWVPAVYKYGTLDAELFKGISCLTHIPWMDLVDVHGVNPVPDTDIRELIFYGLYPDGGCVVQTYKWGTASAVDEPDETLYSVLPFDHIGNSLWLTDKVQHFDFDMLTHI